MRLKPFDTSAGLMTLRRAFPLTRRAHRVTLREALATLHEHEEVAHESASDPRPTPTQELTEMPVYRLGKKLAFPDPSLAHESGLLAVGGDLSPERLLLAYSLGIFPWFSEGQPILWHSPDPRMVLVADDIKTNQSLRQALKRRPYRLTLDTRFREVIQACSQTPRPGQNGTWITDEMLDAYCALHALGLAHSVESWDGDKLVGGLYGVSLGAAFFGESMFAHAPDASKIAFVKFAQQLIRWNIRLIDCQVHTAHLDRFGATEWPRAQFLEALREALTAQPTRQGRWVFDADLAAPPEPHSPKQA